MLRKRSNEALRCRKAALKKRFGSTCGSFSAGTVELHSACAHQAHTAAATSSRSSSLRRPAVISRERRVPTASAEESRSAIVVQANAEEAAGGSAGGAGGGAGAKPGSRQGPRYG